MRNSKRFDCIIILRKLKSNIINFGMLIFHFTFWLRYAISEFVFLWESASRSISAALVVHVPSVIQGRACWLENKTVYNAINIDKGVIVKSNILRFQNRENEYPHLVK